MNAGKQHSLGYTPHSILVSVIFLYLLVVSLTNPLAPILEHTNPLKLNSNRWFLNIGLAANQCY